jgi:hypothetical protein
MEKDDVYGVLDVNDDMEVLAPDWFLETEGRFVVVTPTSEYKEPTRSFKDETEVMSPDGEPFPISLEEWQGVNHVDPENEHVSSVSNGTIDSLVPDKILIKRGDDQRVYRVPRE